LFNFDLKIFLIVSYFFLVSISSTIAQNNRANLENKFRLGQSYEQAGELQKAEEVFKELVATQQWNQRYVKALNNIYINQKKYDLSIKLLNQSISVNPKDINFYGMLGTTYFIIDDKEKAYAVWDSAINIVANKDISYKLISNFAIENRDFDKAIEYLKMGKAIAKNPQTYSLDLARIYIANMKYKNAASEYCDILSIQPLQLEPIKRYLAAFITRPGAAKEVEEAIIEHLENIDNRAVKELLAHVYVTDNKSNKAYELMEEIDVSSNGQGVVLYKFAQELYMDGEFDTALNSFESILKNYPNSNFYSSAKLGYARTLQALTDQAYDNKYATWKSYNKFDTSAAKLYDPVIKTYEELIDQFKDSQIASESYLRAAIILFNKKANSTKAVKYLESIVSQTQYSNNHSGAYFLLGKINISLNNLDQAYFYFQKAMLSRGTTEQVKRSISFEQAKIKFWTHQFTEASKLLSSVSNYLQDDMANDALELALIINTNKNDSLNLALYSSALLLAEQGKFEDAFIMFDQLSQVKNAFILSKFSEYKKAEMRVAQNNYGTAIELLDKIIVEDNSGLYNDKSLFLKANIYQFALKNNNSAISVYQNILENYPNSLYFDKSRELIQKLNSLEEPTI
jgi:tetratricopeptide (TPR) repeat protein